MPDALFITPDLGWANPDAMMDAALNPKLAIFYLEDLGTTTESPSYVKGRASLIFNHAGVNYVVPASDIDRLGGNGLHFWQCTGGAIQQFRLSLTAPSLSERATIRASSRQQPRIIS